MTAQRKRIAEAAAGRGHLLLLAGEAGIGKTRVLRAILQKAEAAGFRIAKGDLAPQDAQVPLASVLDLARTMNDLGGFGELGDALLTIQRRRGGDSLGSRRLLVRDIAQLIVEANYTIPADILQALREAAAREESPLGRRTLEQLVRNYEVASAERVPVCQDSGVAVVFLEIGQDVHWVGGPLNDAVQAGIREGTKAGYLRRSVTGDPTRRLKMAWDAAGSEDRPHW